MHNAHYSECQSTHHEFDFFSDTVFFHWSLFKLAAQSISLAVSMGIIGMRLHFRRTLLTLIVLTVLFSLVGLVMRLHGIPRFGARHPQREQVEQELSV